MNTITLIFLPLFFTISTQSPPHFINPINQNSSNNLLLDNKPNHYFELTRPLPTDNMTPSCSINVLSHEFRNTYFPVTVNHTPPPATCEWSHAVLEFKAECTGKQRDRVVGVWVDGVEILRTSTPRSNEAENNIGWNIRKDVSKYSSVITKQKLKLTVMFQNLVNDIEFNGFYFVNVTFLFYDDKTIRFSLSRESENRGFNRKLISVSSSENEDELGFYPYDKPSDMIIPISGSCDDGFWFRIENEIDTRTKNVRVSRKTYKAMLEVYVSFHGDDEFWYMKPPDSYVKAGNFGNLTKEKAKGVYREVLVTIDGNLVGSVIPFPVIYSGGINPLFWKPVVSIGAFDLPCYDIDFTPFLGFFTDNMKHSIGFQVAGCSSFWLVDGNLHTWLDHSYVNAAIVKYKPPNLEIEQEYEFKGSLDGEFELELERSGSAIGWVESGKRNIRTKITEETTFKNKLKLLGYGARKELDQTIKTKTKIKITNENGHVVKKVLIEKTYPLKITMITKPGHEKGTSQTDTIVVQGRHETFYDEKGSIKRATSHDQSCVGTMLVNDKLCVVSGPAEIHQTYDFKDEFGCYSRNVDVVEGDVVGDETCSICVD